jgi:hypothetical protein
MTKTSNPEQLNAALRIESLATTLHAAGDCLDFDAGDRRWFKQMSSDITEALGAGDVRRLTKLVTHKRLTSEERLNAYIVELAILGLDEDA